MKELVVDIAKLREENYNFRLTLQAIADDAETQTSGSYGMKRLSGYALSALDGVDWVDEIPDSKPYKWESFIDFFKNSNRLERHFPDVIFNAARELNE